MKSYLGFVILFEGKVIAVYLSEHTPIVHSVDTKLQRDIRWRHVHPSELHLSVKEWNKPEVPP